MLGPYIYLFIFMFYTCQIINLNESTQVTLSQIRNQWNIILFSRLDIQELGKQPVTFTEDVNFHIHRVYPKVETPHGREMYLPREFSWQCKNGKVILNSMVKVVVITNLG